MNTQFRQFATVFGLSALIGTAALVAQTHTAVARIPFRFHVRDTVLPAGSSSVGQEGNAVLQVRSASTGKAILVMTGGKNATHRQDPHLTFKRYGNEYFLSEVSLPDNQMNMKIPPTSHEKEFTEIAAVVSVNLNGE